MEKRTQYVKYIIVGAGPGGLQMGYFLKRQERDYIILEKNDTAGSFFEKQPIHRGLISINKKNNFFPEEEFNWRHDWNSLISDDKKMRLTEYTEELFPKADLLYQYLQDYSKRFNLNISYNTTVEYITKNDQGEFLLTTTDGRKYQCQVLLMGLGAVKPMVPDNIEGIDLTTGYEEQPLDLEFYRNKRVGIIGQGNAAFETAESLSGIASFVHVLAKSPIKFAWETHFVGDVRAVNNNIFDMYQLKSLHAVLRPRVKKISKLENGLLQTHHEYDYPHASRPGTLKLDREYDVILRCTGWKWIDESLFDPKIAPNTWYNGKYPELTPTWESVNVPNLYFIGGAMQGNDRQAASGFIHGYRYNIRTLHHLLEERLENLPYPTTHFDPFDWSEFLNWMYERVSVSAALFQLYGVLCDILVVSPDRQRATLYQELPKTYVEQLDFGDQHVLMLTLEFGFEKFNESSITFMGPSDPLDTSCAAFLHPVIRHMHQGVTEAFHFGDSLLARWDRPHGSGGAVMSYHYTFQKWVEEKLGLELNLPDPIAGGAYHEWSQEEIERWKKDHLEIEERQVHCERPI